MIMKKLLCILSLVALCGAAQLSAAEIGQPAPDFTGMDINGKTIKLSDYKGKIVVLEAYNLDCPFCANHFRTGAMQALQGDLTGKGVVWLLVNSVGPSHPSHRSPEAARKEWAAEKIRATAWIDDSSGKIGRLYGMKTTPHMFVIAKDGTLAYQGAIDDQPSPDHDPKAAHNYVRDAVGSLLDGKPVTVTQTKSYGCGVKYAD